MTKLEQAAQLLAELQELAGDDKVALSMVAQEEARFEQLKQTRNHREATKCSPTPEEFKFELTIEAHITYKAYAKVGDSQPIFEKKVTMGPNTNITVPSNCRLETYIWIKANLADVGAWDRDYGGFTASYTGVYDINKAGQLTVVDKSSEQLEGNPKGGYQLQVTRHYDQQEKYLRLEVEGYAPGSSYTEKDWTGSKEIQRTIANKVVASAQRVLTIVTAPYVRQTIGTKELVFEKENQAVLSSDQEDLCWKWWDSLQEDTKEAIKAKQIKIVVVGFASPPGTNNYNRILAKDRAMRIAKMLSYEVGTDLNGESLAIIEVIAKGERTEDPRRYVMIKLVAL